MLDFIGEDLAEELMTPLDEIKEKKLGRFLEADLSEESISND